MKSGSKRCAAESWCCLEDVSNSAALQPKQLEKTRSISNALLTCFGGGTKKHMQRLEGECTHQGKSNQLSRAGLPAGGPVNVRDLESGGLGGRGRQEASTPRLPDLANKMQNAWLNLNFSYATHFLLSISMNHAKFGMYFYHQLLV